MGYATIQHIRQGLASEALVLPDITRIGVDCYEDFQEKMDRKEVRQIGDIVVQACREKFPGADIDIMGSFRRRKEKIGDVDVLITHPDFFDTTPRGALGELVSRLKRRGHIAYHLNHVEGVSDSVLENSSEASEMGDLITKQPSETFKFTKNGQEQPGSASYMGVFFSPMKPGIRRRIDIKLYPFAQKAFATLYFTGSSYFNRSMRLWATRKKAMSLNDHGIYPIKISGAAVKATARGKEFISDSIGASTEREIFDLLGLEYRHPHERDCFDAVVEKGSSKPITLDSEFVKEDRVIEIENNHA